MDTGSLLGSVEVEVKANLDKLVADFARGKVQSQAFANDVSKSMTTAGASTTKFLEPMVTVNRVVKENEALQEKNNQTWANTQKVVAANAAAMQSMQRATNPMIANQRLVAAALRDVETQYRNGTITAGALARAQQMALPYLTQTDRGLDSLVKRFEPLQVAQKQYGADLAAISNLEAAGVLSTQRATEMRGAAARSFEDLTKKIEGNTEGLAGWAVATEHHLRAFRLLLTFVGVDLVARFGEFAVKTLEATASLKDQAAQLGLTTAELQEYKGVASQVGMTSDGMTSAFKTLGKNIDDLRLGRVGPFSKTLQKLGVDITDTAGKVRPTSAIFNELIDKFGQVGDEAQRKGGMMIVFGEAADTMGQLVDQGSAGVNRLREEVRQTGMVLSDEQIQKADVTAKKLKMVEDVLEAKFASTVVENAQAISTLADALSSLATISLERIVQSISALAARLEQLAGALTDVKSAISRMDQGATGGALGKFLSGGQSFDYSPQGYQPGLLDKLLGKDNPLTKAEHSAARALGFEGQPQATPAPRPQPPQPKPQPKGPNIDLSGILSPKEKKGPKEKFDQFDADMAREKERQLQIERDMTDDIVRQNEIDKEIVDLKLAEQEQQIDRQVHDKQLTAAEGKKLKAEAAITASKEKEEADQKFRILTIEKANQYADEMAQLEQDGLQIAKALARTDDERKKIDLAILDSKQAQARDEIDKQLAIATEKHDEQRIEELTAERKKLLENQHAEIAQFDIEHLTGIDKFKYELPKDFADFEQAMKDVRFDLFNQKLQEAAQFAGDIGDAFSNAVDVLLTTRNPLQAFTSLVTDLAKTFNKAVIEEPIQKFIEERVGVPLSKRVFGKDLQKLSGPDPLTVQQMDTALARATGSLYLLERAAEGASGALGRSSLFSGVDFNKVGPIDLGSATDFSNSFRDLSTEVDFTKETFTGLADNSENVTAALGKQIPVIGQFGSGLLSVLNSMAGGSASGGGGFLGGLLKIGGAIAGAAAGGGGIASAGMDFSGVGSGLDFGVDFSTVGFAGGGFTGAGADHEIAGVVHKNEWVWDAPTTRALRPLLAMISSRQIPGLDGGLGLGQIARRIGSSGDVHLHMGQMIFPGVTDERTARAAGSHLTTRLHRELTKVVRKGISTHD